MLSKRIIPCLDIAAGRVVKGTNFVELRDAGDPVAVAARYNQDGADEITFLDITASHEKRDLILDTLSAVASQVFIPLTVGGGIRSKSDVRRMLHHGADKVSFNSAAVHDSRLVEDCAAHFGSQCIVVAIDAKRESDGRWQVYTHGGRNATGLDALQWASRMQQSGAGEILLTSMDRDGTHQGFDIELTKAVNERISIPLIASGGVGDLQHLLDGIVLGGADAVLAASIFHYGKYSIGDAKRFLHEAGVNVRLE